MDLQFLKKSPLFSHLDSKELENIKNSLEKHTFVKGETIFYEEDKANRLYIIEEGKVKIFKSSPEGKEHTLHLMQKNDIIGEAPMFEGSTYPASATCLTNTTMLSISRTSFLSLIKQNPSIALNMLALQAKRLKEFTIKIEKLTLHKLEQRLADYLIQQIDHDPEKKQTIENVNIQELANYLGATRENISRIISKWSKINLATKNLNSITVNFYKLKKYTASANTSI